MSGRRPVIGISLKMYFDPDRTLAWARQVAHLALTHQAVAGGHVELLVLPSLPVLAAVIDILAGTGVAVGAQDLFYEDRGPFTGAVSGADLARIGCTYAEIGHAERRRIFGEDDRVVGRKAHAAWRNGLTPLLCVGEDARAPIGDAERECLRQLAAVLDGAAKDGADDSGAPLPLVLAYEPAWAIGADEPADPKRIIAVIRALRGYLEQRPALARTPVIYGGSASTGLLGALAGQADGLFLGRFAHEVLALESILDEMMQRR